MGSGGGLSAHNRDFRSLSLGLKPRGLSGFFFGNRGRGKETIEKGEGGGGEWVRRTRESGGGPPERIS